MIDLDKDDIIECLLIYLMDEMNMSANRILHEVFEGSGTSVRNVDDICRLAGLDKVVV